MPIFLCEEFLLDLRGHADKAFARRVLNKVLDGAGDFRKDQDDHRYKGIQDAWIRYVSRGRTAYRVIYIRRGPDVFLYRAGEHSVEDEASANVDFDNARPIQTGREVARTERTAGKRPSLPSGLAVSGENRFLTNSKPKLIRQAFFERRLLPHKEIFLISPFISLELFGLSSDFGKMISDLIEDGAEVQLFTRPPDTSNRELMDRYGDIQEQGAQVFFHETLHAKLYTFEVDRSRLRRGQSFASDAAIIGSANLTGAGTGLLGQHFNEELCFELPLESFSGAVEFGYYLSLTATDFESFRARFGRGQV